MAQSSSEIERSADPTSDEIRAQIEHTRAEITETINSIQGRLSPSQVAKDVHESVLQSLRTNPVAIGAISAAVAMVGVRLLGRPRTRAERWRRRAAVAACASLACCSAMATQNLRPCQKDASGAA